MKGAEIFLPGKHSFFVCLFVSLLFEKKKMPEEGVSPASRLDHGELGESGENIRICNAK